MTTYKGFKFRLYPTKEQAERINKTGDSSCFIITGLLVRPGWPEPNVCGECDLC